MKRKIFGALFMAACLPMALQAADVTVVKETPIAVGERISITASPETNRIIREETMKARQDKTNRSTSGKSVYRSFASNSQTRDSERKSYGFDIPTSAICKSLRDESNK